MMMLLIVLSLLATLFTVAYVVVSRRLRADSGYIPPTNGHTHNRENARRRRQLAAGQIYLNHQEKR